ncbi:MAG: hypothetical protein HYS32_00225 [Candidatus Woesearchaeota archaeon]|nr:MAG: hypothetical protein HYS32_00225 [Candidatus Woesearchaeota archaeon]
MAENRTFVFEGITGSGKSTQIRLLSPRIHDLNPKVLGRTSPIIGAMKEMRRLITEIGSPLVTQSLVYILENVAKVETAKEHDGITIIDRFVISNVAYLVARAISEGHCIDRDAVRRTVFTPFGVDLLQGKTIIYLDCDVKEAESRTTSRGSRERFDFNLHSLARIVYNEELDRLSVPIHRLDTTCRKPEEINLEIEKIVRGVL